MIKLYYYHPACSMASHIVLEESGLAYEASEVDMDDPQQKAALLEMNPAGKVPTLLLDGEPLSENIAILTHIDKLAPEAHLFPEDELERSRCLAFLAWCSSTVHIAFRQIFRPDRFTEQTEAYPGIQKRGRELFWQALTDIDSQLQQREFIYGEHFTVADAYLMVFYNWGTIAEFPMESLINYASFKDRMLIRPAVRKVLQREGCPLLKSCA